MQLIQKAISKINTYPFGWRVECKFGDLSRRLPLPIGVVDDVILRHREDIPNLKWSLKFRCNICSQESESPIAQLGRELASCSHCQSTVRMRGMIHGLSLGLFGKSLAISDFPVRPDLVGLGMSDWFDYAYRLSHKLNYTNTFYHQEPLLDITDVPESRFESCDFLLSTDVFEHVAPPVSRAFGNAYRLLKKGGVFVFSVPYTFESETLEHFPSLNKFRIEEIDGRKILINTLPNGKEERFANLVFHGGPGETLEMRVFSHAALLRELKQAGFSQIRTLSDNYLKYGIFWPEKWSLPILATKN